MKKQSLIGLLVLLIILNFTFMSCGDLLGGGMPLSDLQIYQNAGADVAAKTWSKDYDCSNFSTQFY